MEGVEALEGKEGLKTGAATEREGVKEGGGEGVDPIVAGEVEGGREDRPCMLCRESER